MEMNDFEELAILTEEWWYMMDKLKKGEINVLRCQGGSV